MLQLYLIVFLKPKGLPPQRAHDHKIPLEPKITPSNIRQYKYPRTKNEIENVLQEMLEVITIKRSMNPFSLSVPLVNKKGNTQRMCVHYKALNQIIVPYPCH